MLIPHQKIYYTHILKNNRRLGILNGFERVSMGYDL